MNLDAALLEILACPACKAPLEVDDPAGELVCTNADCALAYPVRDDIPVLLVDEARKPGDSSDSAADAADADSSDAGAGTAEAASTDTDAGTDTDGSGNGQSKD